MKQLSLILFAFCIYQTVVAQNSYTETHTDSLGRETTWEAHWAQAYTGRYKSVYNRKEKTNELVKTNDQEIQDEIQNTRQLIERKSDVGTQAFLFNLPDIKGNNISSADLVGKVIVLNFWYIGCSPCEMERLSLNELKQSYSDKDDVVFLSFTTDSETDLKAYLQDSPFLYNVISTGKSFIKDNFDIKVSPESFVIDKDGKYSFHGRGTGIGIKQILQQEIEKNLGGLDAKTPKQPTDRSTLPAEN